MITVAFVNETQGQDLSIEPILITVVNDYELSYNITGTQVTTFEATLVELKEKQGYLELNNFDDATDRDALINRLEAYIADISENVPHNLAVSLIDELAWSPQKLSNVRYCLEDVASGKQITTGQKISLISSIYDAMLVQLGINIKDY